MSYPAAVLGASAILCGVLTYAVLKMFGFGSRNEFVVDGRVRAMREELHECD